MAKKKTNQVDKAPTTVQKAKAKAKALKDEHKAAFALRIKEARERLPSARSKVKCVGCFAPRNTLTVKSHVTRTWEHEEIVNIEGKTGVNLPCKHCGEIRYLNLSKFSHDVFNVDRDTFTTFVLLKDDKYNALVGIKSDKNVLDLTDIVK